MVENLYMLEADKKTYDGQDYEETSRCAICNGDHHKHFPQKDTSFVVPQIAEESFVHLAVAAWGVGGCNYS